MKKQARKSRLVLANEMIRTLSDESVFQGVRGGSDSEGAGCRASDNCHTATCGHRTTLAMTC